MAVMAEQDFLTICFSSQLETTVGESLETERREICILYCWLCPCSTEKEGKFERNGEVGTFCRGMGKNNEG